MIITVIILKTSQSKLQNSSIRVESNAAIMAGLVDILSNKCIQIISIIFDFRPDTRRRRRLILPNQSLFSSKIFQFEMQTGIESHSSFPIRIEAHKHQIEQTKSFAVAIIQIHTNVGHSTRTDNGALGLFQISI